MTKALHDKHSQGIFIKHIVFNNKRGSIISNKLYTYKSLKKLESLT